MTQRLHLSRLLLILTIVILFFLPATAFLNSTSAFEPSAVEGITTCDILDTPKSNFAPGDDIRYKVTFTTENPLTLVLLRGKVNGLTFEQSLPLQYGLVPPGSYTTRWDTQLPSQASGTATVSVLYMGIPDEIKVVDTSFTVTPAAADYVGSQVCKGCHYDTFESLQESSHIFIQCEYCHGPGSLHIATFSPSDITLDKSSALCGNCHTRQDSQKRVEASEGLLKSNQQYDELLSGGKSFFKCVQCHDPHVSLTSETHQAITMDCTTCHLKSINRIHSAVGLKCIDCHMPYAVKKETSTGEGNHLKGDSRTHTFTIEPVKEPASMFYQQGGKTFANGFITLNFVCLGCHNGVTAGEREFDWAVQAAPLIHSN